MCMLSMHSKLKTSSHSHKKLHTYTLLSASEVEFDSNAHARKSRPYASILHTTLNDHACRSLEATQMLTRLRESMKAKRLSVSFEVVARCLSHHGQLPQAEYLVTTAITRLCADGRIEVRT